jgi:hypothetical protein
MMKNKGVLHRKAVLIMQYIFNAMLHHNEGWDSLPELPPKALKIRRLSPRF